MANPTCFAQALFQAHQPALAGVLGRAQAISLLEALLQIGRAQADFGGEFGQGLVVAPVARRFEDAARHVDRALDPRQCELGRLAHVDHEGSRFLRDQRGEVPGHDLAHALQGVGLRIDTRFGWRAWAVTWRWPEYRHARRPLAVLAVSVLLATSLVGWIKSWSNMDCPWDLLQYGGHRPYVGLWEARPAALGHNRCFPGGHASAGYAWMALVFFFLAVRPSWRWLGLATGVVMGLVFGVSQQLRGAHFLSHDVWAALLCWSVAVVVWRLAGRRGGVA